MRRMSFIVFYELDKGRSFKEDKIACFDIDVKKDVYADDVLMEIRSRIRNDNHDFVDYTIKGITKVNEVKVDEKYNY